MGGFYRLVLSTRLLALLGFLFSVALFSVGKKEEAKGLN